MRSLDSVRGFGRLTAACAAWLLVGCGNDLPGLHSMTTAVEPTVSMPTARSMSNSQAEALTVALSGEVLWVDVGGEAGVAANVGSTLSALADSALPHDTPVFVTGDDDRLANAVTRRLARFGLSQVFLVAR